MTVAYYLSNKTTQAHKQGGQALFVFSKSTSRKLTAGKGRLPSAGRAATVIAKVLSLCLLSEIIEHLFIIKICDLE